MSDDDKQIERHQITLIGPMKAGKTTLVSALAHPQSLITFNDTEKFSITTRPTREWSGDSENLNIEILNQLQRNFDRILTSGRHKLASTTTVNRIPFELRWGHRELAAEIELEDAAGELIFGKNFEQTDLKKIRDEGQPEEQSDDDSAIENIATAPLKKKRETFLKLFEKSTGLIFCVPPQGRFDRTFTELVCGFFNELDYDGKVPLKHVAFALTKADHSLVSHGRNAWSEMEKQQQDNSSLVTALSARGVRPHLFSTLKNLSVHGHEVKFAAGFTSIYGFLKENRVNYDPTTEGLLVRGDELLENLNLFRFPEEIISEKYWRPYQVLDPFTFAAWGEIVSKQGFKEISV